MMLVPSQVLKRGAKATTGDSDTARLKEAEVELSSLLIEARVGATTGSESLPVDRPVSSSTNQLVSNHQTTDLGVAEHEYNSQKKSLRMGKCRTKPGEMAVGGNNRHEFSRKSNRAWENARSTDGTSQYVSTKENVSIIAEKPCGRKAAVDWRAVPFADLRKHPLYLPLPDELDAPRLRRDTPESPSASVHVSIPSVAAELCLLRQDSWQWHALHRGRLTTSALAACLGFYEAHTAQYLDIPSSLRGHDRAIGAWTRLCQSPVIDVGSLGLEEAEEPSAASNIYQAPRSSLLGDGSLSILPNPYYRSFNSEAINGGANSFKGRQALASLALIGSRNTKSTTYSNHMSTSNNEEEVWTRDKNYYSDSHRFPFVYLPERSAHGNDIIHYARNAAEARLVWGSSQEATAVLATMNFFHCLNRARDSGVSSVVCESGMCLLERWLSHAPPCRQRRAIATSRTSQKRRKVKQSEVSIASVASETFINQDQNSKTGTTGESFLFSSLEQRIWEQIKSWAEDGSLPLIGASPDGLIVHFSNNSSTAPSIEVLEVKCSSPFVNSEQHGMTISNYVWNQLNRETMQSTEEKQPCLPVWHIPQIQLEMLCAGPQCRSAVVCILSAVDARIYRVHRDDQYIFQMMIVVRSFYQDFVQSVAANNRKPPPANFYSPRRAGGGIAVDCLDAYFLAVGDKEAHVAMGSSNFYKDFLDRTAFLSGKQSAGQFYSNESGSMCELLAVLGEESVQRGNNCSFFKD